MTRTAVFAATAAVTATVVVAATSFTGVATTTTDSTTTTLTTSTTTMSPTTTTPPTSTTVNALPDLAPTPSGVPTSIVAGKVYSYIELPTNTDWLPISVIAPAQVPVGSRFDVNVRCDQTWAGSMGGVVLYDTLQPNPPTYRETTDTPQSGATVRIGADGVFTSSFTAPETPRIAYLRASCLFDAWESDALQPNDSGGTNYYFHYYPPERMVPIEFVALTDERLPATR